MAGMRIGGAVLAVAAGWVASCGAAMAQNCAAIQDREQRLACYDRQTAPPPAPAAAPPGPPVRSDPAPSVAPSTPAPAARPIQPAAPTPAPAAAPARPPAPPMPSPGILSRPTPRPEVETDPTRPHRGEQGPIREADRAYDPLERPPPSSPRQFFAGVRDERRSAGPAPDPNVRIALVAVRIGTISEFAARWEVTISIVNQSQRVIDPEVSCQLTRQGKVIADMPIKIAALPPGHTASVQAVGPPVREYYVDGAACRVIGPMI